MDITCNYYLWYNNQQKE